MTGETELRHLPTQNQLQVAKLLEMDESILGLIMGNIVKNINDSNSELRFNSADIDAVREHAERQRKSSILIFLDEWSTMGKERPKIKNLLNLLVKCNLFHAADYVADLIKETKPERPKIGPAAHVDISLSDDEPIEQIVRDLHYPFSSIDINVNKNQFTKVSPDTPKNIINVSNNTQKTQSTVRVQSERIQESDLMKFSTSMKTIEIPIMVNSSESTFDNIPALSVIHQNSSRLEPPQTISENIPVFLLNSSANNGATSNLGEGSDIPDFSGLLNAPQSSQITTESLNESSTYSSSIKSE